MDLFELNGRVVVNLTDAVKAFNELQKEGQQTESKMKKVFSNIGKSAAAVGKTVAKGLAVSAAAVGALVTKSVQSYAEYEQLVGGVDTLFKNSSEKVQEYAANAYKTAGLSANAYMQTVTSFSASLLQSLDGDTQKAADAAHRAITDMSDNANKMGTSMEMIQNAYNGFAKQNYTMLDNLKLGYGGTKEEMQRLLKDASKIAGVKFDISSYADVVEAIHVMQEEMGIAGTTAKEAASTISGSLSSMKGAWQNLLTAVSSDDLPFDKYVDAFVESVTAVTGNLMPRIETALNGVAKLIEKLAPVIISKLPGLLSTLVPSLITAAVELVNSIVDVLPGLVDMLVNSVIPQLLTGLTQLINSVLGALPGIVQTLVAALPVLIPQVVNALVGIIVQICATIPQIIQPLVAAIPGIIQSFVSALTTAYPSLINGIVLLFEGIVAAIPTLIYPLLNALPGVLQNILDAITQALPILINGIVTLVMSIVEMLPDLIQALVDAFPGIIQQIVDAIITNLPILIDGILQLVFGIVDALPEIIQALVESMPMIISTLVDAIFQLLPEIIEGAIRLVAGLVVALPKILYSLAIALPAAFMPILGTIKGVFTGVPKFFTGIFQKAYNGITSVFSKIGGFFKGIWKSISGVFSGLGTKIGNAISGAVKSGINGLIGLVEKRINLFLKLINGAIGIINEIPGVSISKIKLVSFQRLAKGGVVDKPTPAIFGEDGAEAVVPLENNTGWIRKVSKQLHEFTVDGSEMQGAWDRRSVEIQQQQLSAMGRIEQKIQALLELLEDFFPEALGRMNRVMEMDGVVVARTLAPRMDVELGRLAVSKERGAR